uniref:Solute carrier family 35 member D3 n=1 Tax=Phallusia mammillata TaxID=59560 RepID=A0A6F9DSU2_9ASCI|nr:solute carrier family 35 member D3 [Phallusia mammillata]
MFILGGVIPTAGFVAGLLINFSGGLMYIYAKYVEKKQSAEHEKTHHSKVTFLCDITKGVCVHGLVTV